MPYEANTGTTSVEFGATLRIGYRVYGSTGAFTYLNYFPSYNELPYTFHLPSNGVWEVQYTQICPNCSGSKYSDPLTAVVTIT